MKKKISQKIEAVVLVTVMILTVATTVEASNPHDLELEWQRTFGGEDNDGGRSVDPTFDGGYIVAGWTKQTTVDILLIKTDADGNETWNKTFGTGTMGCNEFAYSVNQTSDGGYIITGWTNSYGAGYNDVWLIKTDESGNEQWNKTYDGGGASVGNFVQQTSDGGYIIAGYKSVYSAWLIKTNATGYMEWNISLDGWYGKCTSGMSVQQTNDGYIWTGIFHRSKVSGTECFLMKVNANGVKEWNRTYYEEVDMAGNSVKQTEDGGYIVAGSKDSQVWLLKTDANGEENWSYLYGGQVGYSVDLCSDGGYIVTGLDDDQDVYVIKTDEQGQVEAMDHFGGDEFDIGYSVRETSVGCYIIAGNTKSFDAGFQDIYLLKVKLINDPPNAPIITGPAKQTTPQTYLYNFTLTDPDEDNMFLYVDWDDGDTEEWIGPYPNGWEEKIEHCYSEKGTYTIKAKAKDIYGAESEWGYLKVVKYIKEDEGCIAGTQITMASGFPSTKPIEDIEAEEFILSYDPISQVTTIAEVIEVYEFTENPPLTFNGNLEITSSHTLYINGSEWMEADDAQIGYYMLGNTPGTSETYPVNVSSKEPSTGPAGPIYDLVIQPVSGEACGYFADGILVGGYD